MRILVVAGRSSVGGAHAVAALAPTERLLHCMGNNSKAMADLACSVLRVVAKRWYEVQARASGKGVLGALGPDRHLPLLQVPSGGLMDRLHQAAGQAVKDEVRDSSELQSSLQSIMRI